MTLTHTEAIAFTVFIAVMLWLWTMQRLQADKQRTLEQKVDEILKGGAE